MRKTRLTLPSQVARRMVGLVNFYYDSRRQKVVARKWPRKNTNPTPNMIAARKAFGIIAHEVVTEPAEITDMAKQLAKGTDYLWRDLLMSAAYGNLLVVETTDGLQCAGGAIALLQIQVLLNSISATNGALICNTPQGWAALVDGVAGQVLTMDVSGLPEWSAPPAIPPMTYDAYGAAATAQSNAEAYALALAPDYVAAPASPAKGDVMMYDGSTWALLAPGTLGDVLTSGGSGAALTWQPASGGGSGGGFLTRENVTATSSPYNHTLNNATTYCSITVSGFYTVNITMPAAPSDGQQVQVYCKTAVNSYAQLNLKPNTGQTMSPNNPQVINGGTAGEAFFLTYDLANTNWEIDESFL